MRRDVRELEPAGDVAGGEDVAEARPAATVDTDVSPLELDAELVQAETGDCDAAAGRDEECVAAYPFMLERELDLNNLVLPFADGVERESRSDVEDPVARADAPRRLRGAVLISDLDGTQP